MIDIFGVGGDKMIKNNFTLLIYLGIKCYGILFKFTKDKKIIDTF
jgi:hypothetical protein